MNQTAALRIALYNLQKAQNNLIVAFGKFADSHSAKVNKAFQDLANSLKSIQDENN